MTSTTSSIKDLIISHNLFDGHQVVRESQVWSQNLSEVSSINSHASDAVFQAIRQVNTGQCQVRGITITADKGLGKTHIISRVHHSLQAEGGALFIYMAEYEDLNRIKPEFLQTLALSLRQSNGQGVMQWQELAVALVNQVYKTNYKANDLLKKFPSVLINTPNLLDNLTAKILQFKPDIDPYLIRAVLWTLSQNHAAFAIKWLSGEELAQSQADGMGLPPIIADSSKILGKILNLICDYKTPLICFDELDGTGCDDKGMTRAQVVASLVKDLYNQIKRGVLLTTMYPETWKIHIEAMSDASAVTDRMAEFSSGKPITLRNLNSDEVIALVSQRLKKLSNEHEVNLPHPVYPFDENELRKIGKQGLTAREVLTWCAEKIKDGSVDPNKKVEIAFNEEIEGLADFIDDKTKIAQALIFGFNSVIGQAVERVRVDSIESPVQGSLKIDFKVIGEENGKIVKIGVAVIQDSGGRGIAAALNQLKDYKKFDLTRGCFVRSKTIPPNAKVAEQHRKALVEQQGGEWVLLKEEEIKPLIAIWSVYKNRESWGLSEAQIFNFVSEKGSEKELGTNNLLIKEILSDPSGETPEGLVNEDALFEEASTMPSEASEFNDELNLDTLLASIVKG